MTTRGRAVVGTGRVSVEIRFARLGAADLAAEGAGRGGAAKRNTIADETRPVEWVMADGSHCEPP